MNRHVTLVFIAASFFTVSCSKKHTTEPNPPPPPPPASKVYLPVSVYESTNRDTTKRLIYTLSYDDRNRIVQSTYGTNDTVRFKYDGKDRLIEYDQYNTHQTIFSALKFEYTNDSITTVSSYISGKFNGNIIYHLHNGLLVLIDFGNGRPTNYKYDDRKNVIESMGYSYTYDTNKSPFSMVAGFYPFFMTYHFALTYPGSNVNNRLTDPINQWTLTYALNKDGFPAQARIVQAGTITILYHWYNYVVR